MGTIVGGLTFGFHLVSHQSGSPPALAARHAKERDWHNQHTELGEDENVNLYKQLVLERVRQRQWRLLGEISGKKILEIGCGVGRETVELAQRGGDVLAVDLSPKLVEIARARVKRAGVAHRVEFMACAAESLGDLRQQFDVVIGNGVLHHLELPRFRKVLADLLKAHGVAQFHEPLIHNPLLRLFRLLTPHLRTPTERPLSRKDVRGFVEGFKTVRVEYNNLVGLALLPTPYVLGVGLSRVLLHVAFVLDAALFAGLPFLRSYSQYVLIQVVGPPCEPADRP